MGNFFDYLDWRGDLTFEQSGINEVDCLILSYFAYADLSGIVPGSPYESICMKAASAKYMVKRQENPIPEEQDLFRDAAELLIAAGKTARFAGCRLSFYINHLDYEHEKQFCALCIQVDQEKMFVSYSGTDETILGWKEDFNMSFMPVVPSQIEAKEYLEQVGAVWKQKLVCGGHSKGGNLAIYASALVSPEIRKRIYYIFNFDGPGFQEAFVRSEAYKAVESRIRTMVPQTSVVGMLLEHVSNYTVIKTTQKSIIAQHLAVTWEIMGSNFVRVDDVTKESRFLDRTIRDWLVVLAEEDRKAFFDTIYKVLDDAGIHTVDELLGGNLKLTTVVRKEYQNLDANQKEMLNKAVKSLMTIVNETYRSSGIKLSETAKLFSLKNPVVYSVARLPKDEKI